MATSEHHVEIGQIIRCWPDSIRPPQLDGTVSCVALVTGLFEDDFAVHYWLPDGANGFTRFSGPPAGAPVRGGWWIP